MKPAPFRYDAPESLAEAIGLLADHGEDAKILAGGQSLVPMLALRLARFERLVDLGRIGELARVDRANGSLQVGAMTRQAVMGTDPLVTSAAPLLARATPLIGHFQIRNRGTVGGSLSHADPASEYPAVAVALGAEMEITGRAGDRSVPATEFFESTWTTCLAPDELLVGAKFPVWSGRCGYGIEEVARRLGDFALAGAACAVSIGDDDRVDRVGIGLFGMGSTPVRAETAQSALHGRSANELNDRDLYEIGRLAVAGLDPPDDVHATGHYRESVCALLATRALRTAMQEARGPTGA